MPEFPGGQGALLKFLATNVRYPESAVKNGIEGRVSCSFVVGKDGAISEAEVIRGVSPELNGGCAGDKLHAGMVAGKTAGQSG